MDNEFLRILMRVVVVGTAILAIGAGTLIVAFRAYAPDAKDRDNRPAIILGILVAFVFLACVFLLRLSFTTR